MSTNYVPVLKPEPLDDEKTKRLLVELYKYLNMQIGFSPLACMYLEQIQELLCVHVPLGPDFPHDSSLPEDFRAPWYNQGRKPGDYGPSPYGLPGTKNPRFQ